MLYFTSTAFFNVIPVSIMSSTIMTFRPWTEPETETFFKLRAKPMAILLALFERRKEADPLLPAVVPPLLVIIWYWLALSSSVTSLVSESTSELFRVDDCEEYLLLDLEIFFFLITFFWDHRKRNKILEVLSITRGQKFLTSYFLRKERRSILKTNIISCLLST